MKGIVLSQLGMRPAGLYIVRFISANDEDRSFTVRHIDGKKEEFRSPSNTKYWWEKKCITLSNSIYSLENQPLVGIDLVRNVCGGGFNIRSFFDVDSIIEMRNL